MEDSSVTMTQTQDMSDLFETQTDSQQFFDEEDIHWGKLVPLVNGCEEILFRENQHEIKIGRHPSCEVHVTNALVSNIHATITRREVTSGGHAIYLTDVSANGTYVNQIKVPKRKEYLLEHGDEISLVIRPPVAGRTTTTSHSASEASSEETKTSSNKSTSSKRSGKGRTDKTKPFARYILQFLREEDKLATRVTPFSINTIGTTASSSSASPTSGLESALLNVPAPPRMLTSHASDDVVAQRFEFMEELGSGAFARVVRCKEKTTGKMFAMKIIRRKRLGVDQSQLETQLREARLLRKINHPYIISLHELLCAEAHIYILTELVTGGELFDKICDGGPYEESQAKTLFLRLLLAVKHLHDQKIVHRDLKPENVLLVSPDEPCIPKIADFGVATTLGLEGLRTHCGTPQYWAPEVIRRRENGSNTYGLYDAGADMWSLGVILFVVLSGRFPFADQELERALEKVKWGFEDEAWLCKSDDVKDLIRKLLEPNPKIRLTVDQAIEHAWFDDIRVQECALEVRLSERWKHDRGNDRRSRKRRRHETQEQSNAEASAVIPTTTATDAT